MIWQISPQGGLYWPTWREHGIASLDSKLESSIEGAEELDEESLKEVARDQPKNRRSHQALRFQEDISVGDKIIARRNRINETTDRYFGIGIVTEEHHRTSEYKDSIDDFDSEDIIGVDWLIELDGAELEVSGADDELVPYGLSDLKADFFRILLEELIAEEIIEEIPEGLRESEVAVDTVPIGRQQIQPVGGESVFTQAKEKLQSELRPHIYKEALAHLVAGKNIVFQGPPGTGKTRAAQQLCEWVCGVDGYSLTTAHAELTRYDLVGGYVPVEEGFEAQAGILTKVAQQCQESVRTSGRPAWIIIDELNRANLDQAFGEVFTLLDLDYRLSRRLEYGDKEEYLPLSFRIISTMNSYDRAQLFELGYAFRRRFAFVRIDSLLSHEVTGDIGEEPDVEIPGHPDYQQVREDVIEESALSNLAIKEIIFDTEELTNDSPNRLSPFGTDCAPINPEFAERESLETKLSELKDQLDIHPDNGDFVDVILEFCLAADHLDLVDIGQALAIDAVKFVLSYSMLFEDEELDSKVVDNAVISYLLPQLDNIMPELRQAETVNPESNVPEKFEQLVQFAYSLNLERTAERLKDMQETRSFV